MVCGYRPDVIHHPGSLIFRKSLTPSGIDLQSWANREQLFKAYGRNQNSTPNCHVRVVYAPNEVEDAQRRTVKA